MLELSIIANNKTIIVNGTEIVLRFSIDNNNKKKLFTSEQCHIFIFITIHKFIYYIR